MLFLRGLFSCLVWILAVLMKRSETSFSGGTLSWRSSSDTPNKVTFIWTSGWTLGEGPSNQTCDASMLNSIVQSSRDVGLWNCENGCGGTPVDVSSSTQHWMTSYDAVDVWEQEEELFSVTFPGNESISFKFNGGTWRTLANVSSDTVGMHISVDLRNRSDTGLPNSSPITASLPVYRIQHTCSGTIKIPVVDPDGDVVRCRWANTTECGSVCDVLPGFTLNEETCELQLDTTAGVYLPSQLYGVALMVEDFPRQNITLGLNSSKSTQDALSSIPLQFVVKTPEIPSVACSSLPSFVTPTSDAIKQITVAPEETVVLKVYAANLVEPSARITDFLVSSPRGVLRTSIRDDDKGRANTSYSALYWTPTQDLVGEHFICVVAKDDNGKTSQQICFSLIVWDTNECTNSSCKNNGICLNLVGRYACACNQHSRGRQCEILKDPCSWTPCLNSGACTNVGTSYTCSCPAGYTGNDCQTNIDDCAGSPCIHGNCTDQVNSYTCACDTGWIGANCDQDTKECNSYPCQNNATCVEGVSRYDCSCIPGYNGTNCETEINECNSSPCLNGGVCTNLLNDFACNCSNMWTGKRCEILRDPCSNDPCGSNAICDTSVPHYKCTCPPGQYGFNCSVPVTTPPPVIASDCHCATSSSRHLWFGCMFTVNCSCLHQDQQKIVHESSETCQRDILPLAYAGSSGVGLATVILVTSWLICYRCKQKRRGEDSVKEEKKDKKRVSPDWADRVPTVLDKTPTPISKPKRARKREILP